MWFFSSHSSDLMLWQKRKKPLTDVERQERVANRRAQDELSVKWQRDRRSGLLLDAPPPEKQEKQHTSRLGGSEQVLARSIVGVERHQSTLWHSAPDLTSVGAPPCILKHVPHVRSPGSRPLPLEPAVRIEPPPNPFTFSASALPSAQPGSPSGPELTLPHLGHV